MIEKNSLRIGNWILFSPSGKKSVVKTRIVRVKELHEKLVIVKDGGLDLELFYESSGTQPIPLTPEILLAAGFERVSELTFDHKDGNTVRDSSGQYWYYVKTTGNLRSIENLHQLQNLYFSLTGKEIEISL